MSHDHSTGGFETFDAHVKEVENAGVACVIMRKLDDVEEYGSAITEEYINLRMAVFVDPTDPQRIMVAEEYLSKMDPDCDGQSMVDIVVYPLGQRPVVKTHTLNWEEYSDMVRYKLVPDPLANLALGDPGPFIRSQYVGTGEVVYLSAGEQAIDDYWRTSVYL